MRKISSAAIVACGHSPSVIAGAIRHILGQRSVVLKFVPPAMAPGRGLAGCDIVVLDWRIGFQNARRIVAGVKAVTPRCVVVVYSRAPFRRDQVLQAGADVCAKNGEFASLCQALVKAVRLRR